MNMDIEGRHQRSDPPQATTGTLGRRSRSGDFAAEGLVAQLAWAERACFRRLAALALPPNQVLCSGKSGLAALARCTAPDAAQLARHAPGLAMAPRVLGLAFGLAGGDGEAVVEEGLMTLRAQGQAAWHAEFMVERALHRAWRGLWVSGQPGFRRQVIDAARRLGLEAVPYDRSLPEMLA